MESERVLADASFQNATNYFVAVAAIGLGATVVGIPLAVVVVPLVWIARTVEYRHLRCTLTPRSLKVRRGWLNKEEKTIPLDKITDLALKQGPIMRLFEIEAISVETAGQTGQGGALVRLVGIRNARDFRDAVLTQRDRVVGSAEERGGAATGPAGEGVLGEIRDALLRIEARLTRVNGDGAAPADRPAPSAPPPPASG
jgi:putative membrane protein